MEDYSHGKWHHLSRQPHHENYPTKKTHAGRDGLLREKELALGTRLRERGGSVTPEQIITST